MLREKHIFLFLIVALLSSCSNKFGKEASKGVTAAGAAVVPTDLMASLQDFEDNIGLDYGPSTAVLGLWQRGPGRDNNSLRIDATDNLETLERKGVALYGLDSIDSPLRNEHFFILDSVSSASTTNPGKWAGREIPWRDNPDFKMLMTFAHLSRARIHTGIVFPNLRFSTNNLNLLQIPVYAAERGDPLATGYFPALTSSDRSVLMFYDNSDRSIPWGTSDEGDAILHEYGHVVQHALNKSVMEFQENSDTNILLEALSDIFVAALTRDDVILEYLASNSPLFYEDDRTGPTHIRSLRQSLSFPYAYTHQIHLDGRVISGAFNDIRKLVQGETVQILRCSQNCGIKTPGTPLSKSAAFDFMLKLSHSALQDIVRTSTLQFYMQKVVERADDEAHALCAGNQTCKTQFANAVAFILRGRGLLSLSDFPQINNRRFEFGSGKELEFFSSPAFIGVGGISMSNSDTNLNPCEAVVVAPYFKNNTTGTTKADMFDIYVYLKEVSGFTPLSIGGEDVEALDVSSAMYKLMGFVNSGFDTRTLLRTPSSMWYQTQPTVGSQFARRPSLSNLPSPVGWAMRAPATGEARVKFQVQLRRYNTADNLPAQKSVVEVVQTLQVTPGVDFCH